MLAPPAAWTQWTNARDADGKPVGVYSQTAVSFCMMGAVYRASSLIGWPANYPPVADAALAVLRKWGGAATTDFNDRATHQRVLGVFDKSIEET